MKQIKKKLLVVVLTIISASLCNAQGSIVSFTLVNSTFNTDIRTFLVAPAGASMSDPVNIRANVTGPVESVAFFIDGTPIRIENEPPYALAGDNNGDYFEWMKTPGLYHLTAVPYTGNNAQGTPGSVTGAIVRVYVPNTTYTLVNADTDTDIGPLTEGHILNLATLPTNNINIRVNSAMPNTESVWIDFTGTTFDRFENEAPYSVFTDVNGNYNAWCCPNPGSYTISSTPYTGNNGSGTSVAGETIAFTIINSSSKVAALETYPNPSDNTVTLSIPDGNMKAEVVITDISGKEYYSGIMEISSNGTALNLSDFNMSPGIYIVKVTDGTETRISRILKK